MRSAVFKVDVGTMKGEVVARLPSFNERYDYLDELELDETSLENTSTKGKIKVLRRLVDLSLPHYEAVDVTDEATGDRYQCVEDLKYGASGHDVLMDLASKIINGGVPKTKPQAPSESA